MPEYDTCWQLGFRPPSDVDIGVLCSDAFYHDVESGVVLSAGSIKAATYEYA
jgi:hypothetical protein